MSPCGGECRVGRTLLRGGQSSPARGADPRRRQHRPIATNKPSTSAAARRPPIATPSAAQAAGAARAPRTGRSRMLIAVHGPARPPAAAATSASSFHEEFHEIDGNSASRRRQRVGRIAGRSVTVGAGRRALARAEPARVWLICAREAALAEAGAIEAHSFMFRVRRRLVIGWVCSVR